MYKIERTKLSLAEENPWYVLATLYGEEPDEATQNKNRIAWNSWAVSKLDERDKQAIALSRKDGLAEIVNWEGENGIKEKVEELFKQRLPNKELPNCGAIIDFSKTEFSKEVNFSSFFFCSYVLFSDSNFLKNVYLSSALFRKFVVSKNTIFCEKADFNFAIFEDHATFSEAIFNSLSYELTVFEGQFNFSRAVIMSESDFTFCLFNMSCDFSEVHFLEEYPKLKNTIFRERITLSAKKNTDKVTSWPDPQNCQQNPEEAKDSCANLRHLMNAQGLPEQAHFFFRREMQFASKIGSSIQRLPYKLFGLFSDYGHSIARPLRALAGLWALPMVIFWVNVCTGKCANTIGAELWVSLIKIAGLSIANIFQITGLQRVYWPNVIECLPWGLKFLGGAQTLLAIPLLFLLLLGLRNRFRLK